MAVFNGSDKAIVDQVHEWFRDGKKKLNTMRKEMREDYQFYAGEQWESSDEQFLRDNNRYRS